MSLQYDSTKNKRKQYFFVQNSWINSRLSRVVFVASKTPINNYDHDEEEENGGIHSNGHNYNDGDDDDDDKYNSYPEGI
jgi:hypothetical protein